MKMEKCDMYSARFFGEVGTACDSLINSLLRQGSSEAAFLLIAARSKEKDSEESEYFGKMQRYRFDVNGLSDPKESEILAKATAEFLLHQRPKFMFDVLDEIIKSMSFEDLNMLASLVVSEQEEFARGYK